MNETEYRGTNTQQNRVKRRKICKQNMISVPMTGEISPNIMFCGKNTKGSRTAPDGCKWFHMDAVGSISTEGQ